MPGRLFEECDDLLPFGKQLLESVVLCSKGGVFDAKSRDFLTGFRPVMTGHTLGWLTGHRTEHTQRLEGFDWNPPTFFELRRSQFRAVLVQLPAQRRLGTGHDFECFSE